MVGFDELVDFSTCPDGRAIAVSGEVVDGAVGIESWVESKACAYTSSFHLSLFVHVGIDVVPCEEGLCSIAFCINPTLVDGVGDAVAVDDKWPHNPHFL